MFEGVEEEEERRKKKKEDEQYQNFQVWFSRLCERLAEFLKLIWE